MASKPSTPEHQGMSDIAQALAARLESGKVLKPKERSGTRVEGKRGGRLLRFAFWKQNDSSGWLVTTRGAKLPLVISVARHRLGEGAVIERGAMLDISLGDESFDAAWRVEGAPLDTTKSVLDAEVRALLSPFDAILEVDEERICLAPPGSKIVQPTVAELDRAADLIVAVADRVARAAAELGPKHPSLAERRKQVKALKARQQQLWARATWWERILIVFAATVLLAAACAFLYGTFF